MLYSSAYGWLWIQLILFLESRRQWLQRKIKGNRWKYLQAPRNNKKGK
jgi:hypothetical protein